MTMSDGGRRPTKFPEAEGVLRRKAWARYVLEEPERFSLDAIRVAKAILGLDADDDAGGRKPRA